MADPQSQIAPPLLIDDSNLSRAWARAFLHTLDHPGKEIAPLVLSVTGFGEAGLPQEEPMGRTALEEVLERAENWDVEPVAFTIFPQRYWLLSRPSRARLFAMYRDAFPRLQAMNPKNNRRGHYFERLTMYGRGPCGGNQLEW